MNHVKKYKKAIWLSLPTAKPYKALDAKRASLRLKEKKTRQKSILSERKPIRKVSKRQSNRMREYMKVRNEFLRANPFCRVCGRHGANEVHHQRGRVSSLLTDQRYFIPVHNCCHMWIHSHIEEARALGLLAPKMQWNKVPREDKK